MPALNFKKEFVDKIKSGEKTCTIRRKNKIIPGNKLILYTGMRTKNCEKIKEVTCQKTTNIIIKKFGIQFPEIKIKRKNLIIMKEISELDLRLLNKFAILDGFHSWKEFVNFFDKQYGLPFHGIFINWGSKKKLDKDIVL